MSQLPPLLWPQAFESAVRTLSFTAAGSELGVTQAAISQRIRLLVFLLIMSKFTNFLAILVQP